MLKKIPNIFCLPTVKMHFGPHFFSSIKTEKKKNRVASNPGNSSLILGGPKGGRFKVYYCNDVIMRLQHSIENRAASFSLFTLLMTS
jgi:hypothetical protein